MANTQQPSLPQSRERHKLPSTIARVVSTVALIAINEITRGHMAFTEMIFAKKFATQLMLLKEILESFRDLDSRCKGKLQHLETSCDLHNQTLTSSLEMC